MKKNFIFLCAGLLFFATHSLAQSPGKIVLSDITIPASPGLILLDKAPSSIDRPSTPKGFAASLYSLYQGGAMETAPYWLKNHPGLTYDSLLRIRCPWRQTLAFSAASTRGEEGATVSLGARVQLFRFYSQDDLSRIDSVKMKIQDALSGGTEINLDSIELLRKELQAAEQKTKLRFELAGAWAGVSAQNNFNRIKHARAGAWGTFNWRPFKFPLELTLVSRYLQEQDSTDQSKRFDYFDYGTAANYKFKSFLLQAEYVQRFNLNNGLDYHRFTLAANYKINDQLYLVASFGKNFGEVNNLITMLGIQVGFSKGQVGVE